MSLFKSLVTNVRGKLISNANMSSSSWFKVGGPFELLFIPEDELDLLNFFKKLDHKIPIFIIGALSNTLIRDGGVEGVTIKLSSKFSFVKLLENNIIHDGFGRWVGMVQNGLIKIWQKSAI